MNLLWVRLIIFINLKMIVKLVVVSKSIELMFKLLRICEKISFMILLDKKKVD